MMLNKIHFIFLFLIILVLNDVNYVFAGSTKCPKTCACALLTVVCTGQSLDTVPDDIPPGTIRLDLQQNRITKLSRQNFVNLTSLKYLDLSNNGLQDIENDAFADLINLERIRLNKNKLRSIPEHLFRRMERLHRLDLSENELEILTNAHLVGSEIMKNLQIDKNKLTCIETDVIKGWMLLEIFTLNSNRLTTLDEFPRLKHLRVFRIFDNPWLCDCRMQWISQTYNSSLVVNAKCHRPMMLQGRNLMQIDQDEMKCSGIEKRSTGGCADKKRCPSECACTAAIVDCHDRSLRDVPTNLPNGIEELRLNGNRITRVNGKVFQNLHKLRTLDLSRNQINEIAPDAFEGLTSLQHLHLFHNNITQLDAVTFHGLKELEMLMLNANNLVCLSKDLFKDLHNLHMLSIYKNKIQSIENGTLDSLTSIKAIHLSENPYICDCNLAWLADFLRQTKLLDTSGVKCVFPRRMTGLLLASAESDKFKCKGSEYLTTKNAGQCMIDHPCPSQCVCFGTVIDCSNRGLYSIPEKLPKFATTLLLNKNKLPSIPSNSLSKAINLEKIDLSDNNITLIEKNAFHGLMRLKELVLNNNQLKYFAPMDAGINPGLLERLHLNFNYLECISADLYKPFANLTLLSLAGNHLKAIEPDSFELLHNLKILYLSRNDFTCDCDLYHQLKRIMPSQSLQILDAPVCVDVEDEASHLLVDFMKKGQSKCTYLKKEFKSKICTTGGGYCPPECNCEGTVVRCSNAGLTKMPRNLPTTTTELYLTGNEIAELVDDDLTRLTELVRLDLSKNNIRILTDFIFNKLNKLQVLILAFNKLQCLSDYSFSGLNSLRILSLHGNNLSQLSEQTFSNLTKNLQQVALLNNPFYCGCQMSWFHRWIRDSYVESGLSKCSEPKHMSGQVILTSPASSFECDGTEIVPRDVLAKCNPCIDSPCKNGAICKHGTKKSYECKCPEGYYGEHCERSIDACYGNPCSNEGKCQIIEEGRFKCTCKKGFVGSHCETNIDDCVSHKCQNSGVCVDEVNGYHCECPTMFAGKFCEDKIEVCSIHFNPCKNNGRCQPLGGNIYKCHCQPGFSGNNCSIQIDNCLPNSCNNNGICKSNSHGFACECAAGFVGEFCESPLLPSMLYYHSEAVCTKDTCAHGNCVRADDDEPRCECHFGFTGKDCSIQSTVGFDQDGSYVTITSFNKINTSAIENLGFVLRTNSTSGILFYYGDDTQFVSAELYDGRIRIAISVGRNDPSLMYSYYKVNNGKPHKIRFELKDNKASLLIDERIPQTIVNKGRTRRMDVKTKEPIFLGGLTKELLQKAVNTYRIINPKSLSGCISDASISDINVNFDDESVILKHKTTTGCGSSVNLCTDVKCNNAGVCVQNSTLNRGYSCHCNVSYKGVDCETRTPTCNKERHRKYYEESGCRSLEPIKNANCNGWCGNDNTPFIMNPDGSATGKNCCCKAVKIRQRKVKMICPDGSRRTSIVQIIRKCQCSMCSA